jgi:putative peptidoglycan lipid II flippase
MFQGTVSKVQALLFGRVGTVTMLNAMVAVLAFFKDVLMANYLGTSVQSDAFTLAYFLPDMLGGSLLATSIGISCVPVFSKLLAQEQIGDLWQSVRITVLISLLASSLLVILMYFGAPHLARLMTRNRDLILAILPLLRIMLPLVTIAPLLYIGFSLLQTFGRFALPAGSWIIVHVFVIVVLCVSLFLHVARDHSVYGISAAITLGMLTMTVWMWRNVLTTCKFPSSWKIGRWWSPHTLQIGAAFIANVGILISTQAIYFLERLLATEAEVGTVTGLNYAFRLSQLPFMVFTLAISNVVLPSMAQDIALNRRDQLQVTLTKALTDILIVSIPTTIVLFLLRVPIVSILFERGAFDSTSVRLTSELLKGYSLTISGLSVAAICLRYFLAAQNTRIPLAICFVSGLINAAADILFNHEMGAVGLAYGAFLGSVVSGGSLFIMVVKNSVISLKKMIPQVMKIVVANIPIATIGLLGSTIWAHGPSQSSFVVRSSFLFFILLAAACVYWISITKMRLIQFKNS